MPDENCRIRRMRFQVCKYRCEGLYRGFYNDFLSHQSIGANYTRQVNEAQSDDVKLNI